MALRPWKKVSQKRALDNPWWTYRCDEIRLPNGASGEYHYVHSPGSSMVIPRQDDGTFVMVNQYRYLASRESIEFPCGSVKRNSEHEATARVELEEETGYAASKLTFLGEFNPYNGVTDEMCRIYLAEQLRFVGSRPDDTEEFELLIRSAAQIDESIRDGSLWDGMSIVAWGIARARGIV